MSLVSLTEAQSFNNISSSQDKKGGLRKRKRAVRTEERIQFQLSGTNTPLSL